MKIQDIYQRYQIMPNLQQHMLSVAAVASVVCDHLDGKAVDKASVVAACLLHDMGNIIKFDLTVFPEFLEPQGFDYWQKVKENYIERYGENENVAVELILEELRVSDRVKELVQAISLLKAEDNFSSQDFEKKICEYADNRVGPFGVISIEERLADLSRRYDKKYLMDKDKEVRRRLFDYAHQMEGQVFEYCNISPDQITKSNVSDTIDSLKSFVVSTQLD